jgi:uncharacterized protein (DUF2252 family)
VWLRLDPRGFWPSRSGKKAGHTVEGGRNENAAEGEEAGMGAHKGESAEDGDTGTSLQPSFPQDPGPAVERVSAEERAARGRSVRHKVSRSSHSESQSATGQRDPFDLWGEQAAGLVPDLVPLRNARMLISPFALFMGSALCMASDLSSLPSTGLTAQLCGDAQHSNFGVFKSHDRGLFFDIRDFDETAQGPFEWDVKRLGASLEISSRENGFSPMHRKEIVKSAARSYRQAITDFAQMSMVDVWFSRLDTDELLRRFQWLLDTDRTPDSWYEMAEAKAHEGLGRYEDITRVVNDEPRFVSAPPHIVPIEELGWQLDNAAELKWLPDLIRSYVRTLQPEVRHLLDQYRVAHAARKVSGVGGVGRDAWVVLLLDESRKSHVILEVEQAGESVLERFWSKDPNANHGQRVVLGQRLLQATDDIFLGFEHRSGKGHKRDYYVRQLRDSQASADVAGLTGAGMELWGRMCGWALARAHARSGDRIAIASYLGKSDSFDRAISKFARGYADQNEIDYEAFQRAVRKGRVRADSCA